MVNLILVRHSISQVVEHLPANEWQLSAEGRLRCIPLAEKLARFNPDVIVASLEPKATQTGQLVAEHLGLPFGNGLNLHEHDRRNVSYGSRDGFEARVREFFTKPDELVFGSETAHQVNSRFRQAVKKVVETHLDKTIALVTHGTVMTLFIAQHNADVDSFEFWRNLDMPAFAVLSLPNFQLSVLGESIG